MFEQKENQTIITYGHGTTCTMLSAQDGTDATTNEIVIQEADRPHPIGEEDPSVRGVMTADLPGRMVRLRFESIEGFKVFEDYFEKIRARVYGGSIEKANEAAREQAAKRGSAA
jgi:hypothetical protein